jgi:hypothetical protein
MVPENWSFDVFGISFWWAEGIILKYGFNSCKDNIEYEALIGLLLVGSILKGLKRSSMPRIVVPCTRDPLQFAEYGNGGRRSS